MTISSFISINSHYTRSINLERDGSSIELVKSYIPTSRAKRLLERVAEGFDAETKPRAWSLIGPYGSGKSSFSLFLASLLSAQESEKHQAALALLKSHDVPQHSDYKNAISDTDGFLNILISGSPEPLGQRILKGLHSALIEYWSSRKGKKPTLIAAIEESLVGGATTQDVVTYFKQAQALISSLEQSKPKGVLLVIDELGKFLEYEARHYGANDIFLLQQLAELACEGHDCNLFLFVLLHQSFEQYAKGLGESLKNEWAKVQGRFEEVPFLESAEQTLKVVAKAINQDFPTDTKKTITANISNIVEVLESNEALPSILSGKEAKSLFTACYPLHPITALILPYLCQKLAQNERTLFNFLGSHEDHGFADSVKLLHGANEYITPDVVFDYFITNQSSVVTDHATHRRWAEVVIAIERLGSADEHITKLLKTIGLFNIIGSRSGFKASKALLYTLSKGQSQINKALKALSDKSIVTYRKFNSEYRVWQGSDFDLEQAVQEQLSLLGKFSLAEQLNRAQILKPIVARKYSIENGTVRYFVPHFVDATNYDSLAKLEAETPRVIFFLAYDKADGDLFRRQVVKQFTNNDVVVLSHNAPQLNEAFKEVFALKRIEESNQALNDDPIAMREFSDRLASANSSAMSLVKTYELEPQACDWFFNNQQLAVSSRRDLQAALSDVLTKIFSLAPAIHNELINKDTPSSQAAAGRNKLLFAMLEKANEPRLGIEKFPPEKSMYLSILKEHGIHRKVSGVWQLSSPKKDSSLFPAWQAIADFLVKEAHADASPRSFCELDHVLTAPPFGVKKGILPILYISYYLVNNHELAWYEDGKFQPFLTQEGIERFLKVPHLFSVQVFKLEGLKRNLFDAYLGALFKRDGKERSVLDIAKPLTKFMGDLEKHTKVTRSTALSDNARKVIKAFDFAKSPQKLLFVELPKALGFSGKVLDDNSALASFSNALMNTLHELKYYYKSVLEHEQKLLADAFSISHDGSLKSLREALSTYRGLENYSVEVDGLKAFIKRLTSDELTDEKWLKDILTFLSGRPSQDWNDTDKEKAEFELASYAPRVKELHKLRLVHAHTNGGGKNQEVILLKSLRAGAESKEVTVSIDAVHLKEQENSRKIIDQALNGIEDEQQRLALIANIVDDFLTSYLMKQEAKGGVDEA